MKNLKIYKIFEGLINHRLKKNIFFPIIFVSIFFNPFFLKASDLIEKQQLNPKSINNELNTNLLQKDLY